MPTEGPRQAHARKIFEDKRRVWREQRALYVGSSGPDARDVLWDTVKALPTGELLDAGCGEGELASRAMASGWRVQAIDVSAQMVELASAKGVPAGVQDVCHLTAADESFDCVVSSWVLHYLDEWNLEVAFSQIQRVLRRGGSFVTATQHERHMAELWDRLPGVSYRISYSANIAEELMSRYFVDVRRQDVEGTVVFPDYAHAHRFLANQVRPEALVDELEHFEGSLKATRRSVILSGRRA